MNEIMNNILEQNKAWTNATWEKIDSKLSKTAVRSRDKLPYTTICGVHDDHSKGSDSVDWWTNGFWGGMMWLMYQATGNEDYRKTAERSEELLQPALVEHYKRIHHDVGFMWHLTSGANYRLTGNVESGSRNFFAAASLFSRYIVDGEYIMAWNNPVRANCSIIDCMMNLSILYWASVETGHNRFKKIAMKHADMTIRDHIRPDGSVNHVVQHKEGRVGVERIQDGQGYAPDTAWSRGQAWAVYGTMISYIHTEKAEYLEAAKKTATYFIENCKKTDYKPLIDFCAPPEPVYYDSTAGVCAACGMIELAKYVSGEESKYYLEGAINILKACDQHFCNYEDDQDALVLMGSERYPHTEEETKRCVHKPIIYADFFFVEAMLKLKGSDFLIW